MESCNLIKNFLSQASNNFDLRFFGKELMQPLILCVK